MPRSKSVWGTALTDTNTQDIEGLGQGREESSPFFGERVFKWCKNRSGGSLAVGSLVAFEQISEAAITAAANTDATKVVRSTGTWTPADITGCFLRVLDDAGAAGAAPEGEVGRIQSATTTQVTLAAALTAAVTTGDTFTIHRPYHMIAAADGMVKSEVIGVLMATVANGSYGWVQSKGLCLSALMAAAGTAVTAGTALKPGAGILVAAADNADNGEVVGSIPVAVTTDTVARTAPVYLDCAT